MRKIINGKRYDTETSTRVAYWHNGVFSTYESCEETLYRRPNGEYFLYGWGGPMTAYAVQHGDRVLDGSKIIPLSLGEARQWVNKRCSREVFESVFGEAGNA